MAQEQKENNGKIINKLDLQLDNYDEHLDECLAGAQSLQKEHTHVCGEDVGKSRDHRNDVCKSLLGATTKEIALRPWCDDIYNGMYNGDSVIYSGCEANEEAMAVCDMCTEGAERRG